MKRRILIVEDEAVTSVLLEKTLKELGYEVVGSAFDGAEAINLAREKQPDIILMDIRIQGDMDGIETAKRIYQQYKIPIIYLTAHSDDDTIKRAVDSGPFGYLIKPFKERELYSNIEMVAHKNKLYQTTTAQRSNQPPEPEVEPEPVSESEQTRQVPPPLKAGDYRLAILAIQSIPHPVMLFTTSGAVIFMNNACRSFFKHDHQNSNPKSIQDLPDLFKRIWASGRDRFREGKGFATNGPLQIHEAVRRVRIDMIPLMDKGSLQFITSVIVPEPAGGGAGGGIVNTLLDEADSRLREIRFLSSTEETHRLRRISLYTTEVMKKITELRGISYPDEEKKAVR
ncbi:response regulator [uncultured Methanospirillum sp.]|uniref:response regulator n=1 Tax=uncultured Methanospirillum sp. TaxID=262503 RepID=UPI0029C70DED|nr:response regulator [uncultured Methanospirillum sp.]